jgi:hemerythrin superfamily protein
MTTIYETLKADHDNHRALLAKIAETSGNSETRQALWEEFFYDVGGHAAAEEETFYGPMIKTEDGQPHARHSVAEHHELDELMQDMNETDMSSPGWMAKFKKLRHDYEHHIAEEEDDIFPCARETIGEDKNGEIARAFKARKDKEMDLVDEKAEAALEE